MVGAKLRVRISVVVLNDAGLKDEEIERRQKQKAPPSQQTSAVTAVSLPVPPTLGAPSSRNSTRPFFANIIYRAIGKEETDAKATSNCQYIRIQVRSPLFGVCRFQLGIASKTLPVQDPAISVYRHRCQTLDGNAFRPNHGLA